MPLRGVTVLVVEDDPDSREITGLLLQHLGARVVTVESGDRGLAAVLLHQPDLVLVDLVMPEMDGFEFARRIRSDPRYRRVRLVALTGLRDEATVLKTWSIGFDGHLTKPVTEEGLDLLSRFTVATEPGPFFPRRRPDSGRRRGATAERSDDDWSPAGPTGKESAAGPDGPNGYIALRGAGFPTGSSARSPTPATGHLTWVLPTRGGRPRLGPSGNIAVNQGKMAESPRPLIKLAGVSKTYAASDGLVHALEQVSLDVPTGEFLSILGPSGCGKSTLMLMIAGLLAPSAGEIRVGGKPVTRPQTDVGIVFQNPVLLDWRTVIRNVLLQVEARALDLSLYRVRARELLLAVGLEGFEDKYPFELSGGMRQRTAICRALIHDPPLLLMDEPFGALDALTREQMRLDIERLWLERRKTVVFITHSIPEAVLLSDRVVVMSPRPGRIDGLIDIDLPRPRRLEVQESPRFAGYLKAITDLFRARGVLRY